MILVNKQQVEIGQLAKRLGVNIPIAKILKKPLFEINPALIQKDPANGPLAVKHRNTMEFPAVFHGYTPSGEGVEIRYCTNRTPDPRFMGQTEKYHPKVVEFDGKAEFIGDDKDKAIYFWLHFFNKTSPFKKESIPHEYDLVDDEGRASELIANITLRSKATAHASALSGDELRITAKGMKIAGAATMDDLMLRAQLMQFASDKPAEYLNKSQSQVNHIEGLIRDSIDKGIFIVENVFNSKRWRWGMGVKTGEVIVEMSTSVADENQALITHISMNIQEFLPVLIDTSKTVNAKTNLEDKVKGINVFDMLSGGNKGSIDLNKQREDISGINQNSEISGGIKLKELIDSHGNDYQFDDDEQGEGEGEDKSNYSEWAEQLPASYKEAQDYLFRKIGKKTPALASELNRGIEDGSITQENIGMMMEEYKER